MIGKIFGAFVGDKLAKQTTMIGGPTGAALGVVATTLARRLSIPAMIAIAAGGYAYKKWSEKKAEDSHPPKTSVAPETTPMAA